MMNLLTFTLLFLSNVPVTLSQNCNTGDVVCELIGLHQDGFLSKHKLQNMTNRIDQTASHLIEQTVELSTLHRTQKTTDVQIIDIRSHLYNNKNHTDHEAQRLSEKITRNKDSTHTLKSQVLQLDQKQTNMSSNILQRLEHEMLRVNATLQRDASEQIKEQRKIAELEEKKAIWEIEREKLHRDEAREKLIEGDRRVTEAENRTQRLAKDRIDYENAKIRERDEETTKLNEASDLRQEAIRRETEEALIRQRAAAELEKANVEIEVAIAKAKAEADGKIKQERENEDIKLRLQQSESDSQRRQVLDAINLIFVRIADGSREIISDPERLLRLLGAVILLAAGVYFVREFSKVIAREIERRLGKPSLVRDTSRMHSSGMFSAIWESSKHLFYFIQHLIQLAKIKMEKKKNHKEEEEEEKNNNYSKTEKKLHTLSHFEDVILEKECAARIMELAQASRNAQKNRAPYRHLLFYGPAGTGKSMVAKRLALHSGMDWAIMSGGDVGPLGEQAVTDLHNLFSWARSSSKGLMLFIDEAEAFLGSRSRSAHTVHMRNALNALLFQTGDQSKHFMLVLATNRAADLDAAVLDRIDEAVHFALPKRQERLNIASQYFCEHVLNRAPSYSDAWYNGGGVVASIRKSIDAVLCGQGSAVFGSGLVPSKKIELQDFEKVVASNSSSDTEEMSEENQEEEEEEEEATDPTPSKRGRRGRAKTPVRKKRKKEKKQKNQSSKKNRNVGNHYEELETKIADVQCPEGTLKGIELYMRKTAKITKKFSGRQLAKMMISCQGMIYGTEASTLTPESYWTLVRRKVEEHQRKIQMAEDKSRDDDNKFNYA